jgi:hypothetical protein
VQNLSFSTGNHSYNFKLRTKLATFGLSDTVIDFFVFNLYDRIKCLICYMVYLRIFFFCLRKEQASKTRIKKSIPIRLEMFFYYLLINLFFYSQKIFILIKFGFIRVNKRINKLWVKYYNKPPDGSDWGK